MTDGAADCSSIDSPGVIAPFAIFFGITAPFRSCLVPTLPRGEVDRA